MKILRSVSACFFILFNILNSSAQHFIEHQDAAGIDHIFKQTASLGGGAVFFDADNDGDDDLYITAGNDRDHFYINNGDGTFDYRSIEAGFVVTKLYYTTGVIAGDIDNDGDKDLFVTTWFSDFAPLAKNLLYRNNGDGTFAEIWNQQAEQDMTQAMGATFIDYDLDGLLDIYVASYVDEVGFIYDNDGNIIGYDHTCYKNSLYRNLGNGQFDEKAQALNIVDLGCTLATTATDFDLDGDMDIYVANDFGDFVLPNQLYQYNSDNGFFWGVGNAFGADASMYGMGIAVGDIDNDLDLDYYVTNFGKNILFRNDGSSFTDIAQQSGTADEFIGNGAELAVGWGTAFLDVDNDADLDLYVGNGYVPSLDFLPSLLHQNDKLFLNDGNANFQDTETSYGVENKYATRGVTYSDYDNDGDLDILAVVEDLPPNQPQWATILYNNQSGNQGNWFQATLEGVTVNRDAYGSKVYLYADGQAWMQEISGGNSHASQPSPRVHFGLGDIDHIDSLKVVWTGGKVSQILNDLDINQHIYIKEDTVSTGTYDALAERLQVSISPNPVQEDLLVELINFPKNRNGSVSIHDVLGTHLFSKEVSFVESIVPVDVRELADGLYFLTINMEGVIVSKRFVVRH